MKYSNLIAEWKSSTDQFNTVCQQSFPLLFPLNTNFELGDWDVLERTIPRDAEPHFTFIHSSSLSLVGR